MVKQTTPSEEGMLKAVIEKAIKNGFDMEEVTSGFPYEIGIDMVWLFDEDCKKGTPAIGRIHPNQILFSHSFAKAFWGEEKIEQKWIAPHQKDFSRDLGMVQGHWRKMKNQKVWRHHLQQAVISESPLTYYFERI